MTSTPNETGSNNQDAGSTEAAPRLIEATARPVIGLMRSRVAKTVESVGPMAVGGYTDDHPWGFNDWINS